MSVGEQEQLVDRGPTPEPQGDRPSRIAVLDMKGQYVPLIKKGAERQGFPTDLLPYDTPASEIYGKYGGLVLSGSPASAHEEGALMPDESIWELPIAKLGICYGLHAGVKAFGGKLSRRDTRQDGRIKTNIDTKHPLFHGVKDGQKRRFTHGIFVEEVPDGAAIIGHHEMPDGSTCYSAVAYEPANYVGVQFHPEVFDDDPEGYTMLNNFFARIAGLEPDPEFHRSVLEKLVARKRAEVAEATAGKRVYASLSGGKDSSIAMALIQPVVDPDMLIARYVDNGMMRTEDDIVIDLLRDATGVDVKRVDAQDYFLNSRITINGEVQLPLSEVTDRKLQRNIIGEGFVDVKRQQLEMLGLDDADVMLFQGTNYADIQESKHGIVDHHNMTPGTRAQDLLEPFDDLFKDEIEAVGYYLGLPEEIVGRHPFPGPGLGVRIVSPETIKQHRDGVAEEIQEYFATGGFGEGYELNGRPIKSELLRQVFSAGVAGDEPTYLGVTAVNKFAAWKDFPDIGIAATNRFRDDINRVVVAMGDRPLDDYTITADTKVNARELAVLRHADDIVFEVMRAYNIVAKIKQCPVILIPTSFGEKGGYSIVIRPVDTSTFMTVQPLMPEADLPLGFAEESKDRILTEVSAVTQVFWDGMPKPPGRTEWK